MKRRKRHTLLKFIILAVIAGGVVQYSGVLKDTGVFPEKITNQISVEQKNAKAETYSGTAEEQTSDFVFFSNALKVRQPLML